MLLWVVRAGNGPRFPSVCTAVGEICTGVGEICTGVRGIGTGVRRSLTAKEAGLKKTKTGEDFGEFRPPHLKEMREVCIN